MSTIEILLLGLCACLSLALYLVWTHSLELQRGNKRLRDALASGQTKQAIQSLEEMRRLATVENEQTTQLNVDNLPAFLRKQAE